jgi:4-hydroxy-2-oxoheptanedioate aldolase
MTNFRSNAKNKIQANEPVLAINTFAGGFDVADLVSKLGIDILFIDCERAGIGIDMVGPMARAAQRHGAAAVVRSKTRQVEDWVSYLDRGIDGLIVPRVETAQEARLILETVSYACGSRAADMIIIPQIESEAGMKNIDEILAVKGFDLFLIGPYDLSHSMGFGGDITVPQVQEALDHIAQKIKGLGERFGLPVTLANAKAWQKKGAVFNFHSLEALIKPGLEALKKEIAC